MRGHIVVAARNSAGSADALAWAVRRAADTGSRLTIVTAVGETFPGVDIGSMAFTGSTRDALVAETLMWQQRLVDSAAVVGGEGRTILDLVEVEHMVRLGPASLVLADATRTADLLVLGAGRRGRLPRLARECRRRVQCPVVVIEGDRPR